MKYNYFNYLKYICALMAESLVHIGGLRSRSSVSRSRQHILSHDDHDAE